MSLTVIWILAALSSWVPPLHPGADFTRYRSIAEDVVAVAYDASEPPVFKGPHGRAKTALELAAIAALESQLRADVDDGRVRGELGEVSIFQVLLPSQTARVRLTPGGGYAYASARGDGWNYDDLITDRRKAAHVALAKVRESWKACGNLSLYTSGACSDDEPKAKHRHAYAERWLRRVPAPTTDAEAMPPS